MRMRTTGFNATIFVKCFLVCYIQKLQIADIKSTLIKYLSITHMYAPF